MTLWCIRIPCSAEHAVRIEALLDNFCLSTARIETPEDETMWYVEAMTATEPNIPTLQQVVNQAFHATPHIVPPIVQCSQLAEVDWLEQTWKNFPPLTLGQFYIYGDHNQDFPPKDSIPIKINAATAFGSGEHDTTAGCLALLEHVHPTLCVQNILDMGCGSGILGIAAAKLWQKPVLAVDNDPESVRVATENAILNAVSNHVTTVCSEGFTHQEIHTQGPYTLIIANILARPLIDMASDMVQCLAPQGRIILSGLLQRQKTEVLNAYEAQGMIQEDICRKGDWATLLLRQSTP